MYFFKEYFTSVNREEDSIKIIGKNLVANNDSKKEYIDVNNLVKIILSWLMGGIVSLMPTSIYIWASPRCRELTILQQFFSNKDLFLVITTLTAGAMFEVFCSRKKGIAVYISGTVGVILMVFSLLIFSLLLFQADIAERLDELPYIGVVLLGVCFIYSIISYVCICWKGR